MEIFGLINNDALTNDSFIRNIIADSDCILAYETAADFLGINEGLAYQRGSLTVYSLKELNIQDVDCILVSSFNDIKFEVVRGIRVTTAEQTIIDLLRHNRDDQVIQEAMSYWYETHNQSFDNLNIPDDIRDIFNSYVDDAIHYYDN